MQQCAEKNGGRERRNGKTVRIAERRNRRRARKTTRQRGAAERRGERFCRGVFLLSGGRQEGQQRERYDLPGRPLREREADSFRVRPAVRGIAERASCDSNRGCAAGERNGYAEHRNGSMTEESLRQFERHLQQEGKKASTVEKYLRDVKAFWFWLRETEKESEKSAEEGCGAGEKQYGADPVSGTGEGRYGKDVVSGNGKSRAEAGTVFGAGGERKGNFRVGKGGYGAGDVSGTREREYGKDIVSDIGEGRYKTGDVSGNGDEREGNFGIKEGEEEADSVSGNEGGRDRAVREAGKAESISGKDRTGANRRGNPAEETEDEKRRGTAFSGGNPVKRHPENLSGPAASAAVTKAKAWRWREVLCEKGYAPVTVNAMLTALNLFFRFLGREDCRVKTLRIQRKFFRSSERELLRGEYEQLVRAAKEQGKKRLALLIETMGATGIRVSEVKYMTVEAVRQGRAEIALKGKIRTILIPEPLRRKLQQYAGEKGISSGEIFITKSGKGLSRQQIWAEMKRLCPAAGILKTKVFPHNLRHLFARVFYRVCRDIVKLADVLGHSHIATTRIYLASTGAEHARHLERLHLVSRM